MPSNSTGTIAVWRDATAVDVVNVSPQDAGVRVRQVQAPHTEVELPDEPPTDGDNYDVVDADGSCGAGNAIVITPPAGTTIRGASTFALTTAFAAARVVFDARARDWVVLFAPSAEGGGAGPIALMAGSLQTPYVSSSLNIFQTMVEMHPWPFPLVPAGKTLVVCAFSEIAVESQAIDLQNSADNSSVLVSLITVNSTADFQVYTATLALPLDPAKSYNLVVRCPGGDGGDHVHVQSAYILL